MIVSLPRNRRPNQPRPLLTNAQLQSARVQLRTASRPRRRPQTNTRPPRGTRAPVAIGLNLQASKPRMASSRNGNVVISHRELVQTGISVNNTFNQQVAVPLNPGMQSLTQWLSTIGICFEKYRFLDLEFEYIPRCATSTQGSVMMAIDYNAADAAPDSEQTMSTYGGYRDCSVWQPMNFKVNKPSASTWRFTRYSNIATNLDIKTYDLGNFFLFTSDGASSSLAAAGKLYVKYRVELSTPQLPSSGPPTQTEAAAITFPNSATLSAASPFGAAFGDGVPYGDFTSTTGNCGTNVITPPAEPGTYLLEMNVTGTTLSTTSPTLTPANGITVNSAASGWYVNAAGTAAGVTYNITIGPEDLGTLGYLTWSLASAASLTGTFVRMLPYNQLYP